MKPVVSVGAKPVISSIELSSALYRVSVAEDLPSTVKDPLYALHLCLIRQSQHCAFKGSNKYCPSFGQDMRLKHIIGKSTHLRRTTVPLTHFCEKSRLF